MLPLLNSYFQTLILNSKENKFAITEYACPEHMLDFNHFKATEAHIYSIGLKLFNNLISKIINFQHKTII